MESVIGPVVSLLNVPRVKVVVDVIVMAEVVCWVEVCGSHQINFYILYSTLHINNKSSYIYVFPIYSHKSISLYFYQEIAISYLSFYKQNILFFHSLFLFEQIMLQKPKKLNVPSHKQNVQAKIALVGNQQTGKSSFLSKYLTNECPNYYEATLGVQTYDKYFVAKNGSQVHVTFWDFSGKLDFAQIRNQFYRQCSKILLFVDLSNKNSVDDVDLWLKEIKQASGACPIVVIGNKADNKKVGDAEKIAKSNGCQYIEISAKTGQYVNEMVQIVTGEFR